MFYLESCFLVSNCIQLFKYWPSVADIIIKNKYILSLNVFAHHSFPAKDLQKITSINYVIRFYDVFMSWFL